MGKGEGSGGVNTSDERDFATSAIKKSGKSGKSNKSVTINTAVKYGGYATGSRIPDQYKVSH